MSTLHHPNMSYGSITHHECGERMPLLWELHQRYEFYIYYWMQFPMQCWLLSERKLVVHWLLEVDMPEWTIYPELYPDSGCVVPDLSLGVSICTSHSECMFHVQESKLHPVCPDDDFERNCRPRMRDSMQLKLRARQQDMYCVCTSLGTMPRGIQERRM